MGKTSFNRLNHKIKSWRIGDYFRQFSIVAAGIIVTFWEMTGLPRMPAKGSACYDAVGNGRVGI